MALDPPMEVVQLLNFIGVDWPMINEDTVREVAGFVKEFAEDLQSTHQDATQAIHAISAAYQGASYEALVQGWADKSNTHMTALLDACHVVQTALDAAADFIVAQKVVAIGELIALAASFIADQAAAVATLGLAEAALAAIELAARKTVEFLEQQLEQFIIAEVVEAGFKTLKPVIESAMKGFAFDATACAVGVAAGGSANGAGGFAAAQATSTYTSAGTSTATYTSGTSTTTGTSTTSTTGGTSTFTTNGAAAAAGTGFMIHPDQLRSHTQILRGHADAVADHAQALVAKLSGVSFT
jgi:uncharacterized protein YukE